MYCNNCGTQIPDGALFCTHCGATLRSTGNASATQTPPTSEAERAPISAAASAPATTTTVATSAADARQSPNKQKQESTSQVSALQVPGQPLNPRAKITTKKPLAIGIAAIVVVVALVIGIGAFGPKQADSGSGQKTPGQTSSQQASSKQELGNQAAKAANEALAALYKDYPYEEYVASWATSYKKLTDNDVKKVITPEVYQRLVPLEVVVSYGPQVTQQDKNMESKWPGLVNAQNVSEARFKEQKESLENEYAELDKQLQAALDAKVKPANEESLTIENFKAQKTKDENGNPKLDEFEITGTIVNNSGYALITESFSFSPTGTSTAYNKYGESFGEQALEGKATVTSIEGRGCYITGAQGIFSTGEGIYASDLRPGESRDFTCTVSVGDGNVVKSEKQEKENSNSYKKDGTEGVDLNVTGFSCQLDSAWIAVSEKERLDIKRIDEIGADTLLDPDVLTYKAFHGQLELKPTAVEISDNGKSKVVKCDLVNNTGLYLEKVEISCEVRGENKNAGPKDDKTYSAQKTTNAYNLAPKETLSGFIEIKDIYKLTDKDGKDLPDGSYSLDELGISLDVTELKYTPDAKKNIQEGLLPDNWIDRNKERQQFAQNLGYLFATLIDIASETVSWAKENPQQAAELVMAMMADGISYSNGQFIYHYDM